MTTPTNIRAKSTPRDRVAYQAEIRLWDRKDLPDGWIKFTKPHFEIFVRFTPMGRLAAGDYCRLALGKSSTITTLGDLYDALDGKW